MEGHYDFVFLGFAQKNVGRIVGSQMPEFSATQSGVLSPQPKQVLDISPEFILFMRAPFVKEGVLRIANPATREIAAIVGVAASRHADFIAVIDFWNAAQSECQPESQPQLRRGGGTVSGQAGQIVVREKGTRYSGWG